LIKICIKSVDPIKIKKTGALRNKCCGSGSALILVYWIRIQEDEKDPQQEKKVKKVHVLKGWMLSLEG
jgi:hypothetical protein